MNDSRHAECRTCIVALMTIKKSRYFIPLTQVESIQGRQFTVPCRVRFGFSSGH